MRLVEEIDDGPYGSDRPFLARRVFLPGLEVGAVSADLTLALARSSFGVTRVLLRGGLTALGRAVRRG